MVVVQGILKLSHIFPSHICPRPPPPCKGLPHSKGVPCIALGLGRIGEVRLIDATSKYDEALLLNLKGGVCVCVECGTHLT
jgi:hypothetical protein